MTSATIPTASQKIVKLHASSGLADADCHAAAAIPTTADEATGSDRQPR